MKSTTRTFILAALGLFVVGLMPVRAQDDDERMTTEQQFYAPSEAFVKLPSSAPARPCTAKLTERQIANLREVGWLSPFAVRCAEQSKQESEWAAEARSACNRPFALFYEAFAEMSKCTKEGDTAAIDKLAIAERYSVAAADSDDVQLKTLRVLTEYWREFVILNPVGPRTVRLMIR